MLAINIHTYIPETWDPGPRASIHQGHSVSAYSCRNMKRYLEKWSDACCWHGYWWHMIEGWLLRPSAIEKWWHLRMQCLARSHWVFGSVSFKGIEGPSLPSLCFLAGAVIACSDRYSCHWLLSLSPKANLAKPSTPSLEFNTQNWVLHKHFFITKLIVFDISLWSQGAECH